MGAGAELAVRSLGYIGLTSTNVAGWRDFGTEVLGFASATGTSTDQILFRMDERSWRVSVEEGDSDGLACLGLELDGPSAFGAAVTSLEKAGVAVSVGEDALAEMRQVAEIAVLDDPDGNRIELFWGAREPAEPFISPSGTGFVTADQGVGHVLLKAVAASVSAAFYQDVFGFKLTDFVRMGASHSARFLRCNTRHHSIALVDALPGVGLDHLMVQVQSLDDLGLAHDRALRAGAKVVNGIGRHSNDRMVSFYVEAPGGIRIEYGWGGRLIGEGWSAVEFQGSGDVWGHQGAMMDEILETRKSLK